MNAAFAAMNAFACGVNVGVLIIKPDAYWAWPGLIICGALAIRHLVLVVQGTPHSWK